MAGKETAQRPRTPAPCVIAIDGDASLEDQVAGPGVVVKTAEALNVCHLRVDEIARTFPAGWPGICVRS
jgi:hypothetical protein